MLKSIIFDFDGVIHDTFDLVYPISQQIHGFTVEEYKDMFNGNLYLHEKINEQNSKEFIDLSVKAFKDLQIEKHIREELLKIKNKFELFIVSSNSELILNEYFENNNIIHIFKKVLGVETHRSKIEKFNALKNEYGIAKHNSIFVTDTLGDILEANKAGLNTIAVDFGFHDRTRLEKGNPLKIISDFRELLPEIIKL
ncbi:MAG: HAD hydrolase-like protein [Patescibacteria group bacterium]